MQRKATVDEKAQHTGVCEHFESSFNAIQRDLEQLLTSAYSLFSLSRTIHNIQQDEYFFPFSLVLNYKVQI
jgi:hypothetical protein